MIRLLLIWALLLGNGNTGKAFPSPISMLHEFHISQCQIHYNAEEKALQVSLHLFIDDLEEALRLRGADKLFICTEKESKKAEQYMSNYLQQGLQFKVNEKGRDYEFIGKEVSEDMQGVWCYLELTGIEVLESVEITSHLLLEVFDDQKNIVQITTPQGKQGYFMFVKGKTNDKVTF